MSRPKPQITIVGLGKVGASIGLALRQSGVASAVVGHDIELNVANQARKREAVDKVDWNLISACEGSDLVIVATPIDGIEPTFKAIGPYLRPGCVVMDTASLKVPVLAWAAASLPEQVHFVGADPVLRSPAADVPPGGAEPAGLKGARADLFQDALFCLVPSPQADPAAVKLAADLASLLGGQPFFVDAAEHDSLMVAVEHLPTIVSMALLDMVVRQPGWKELRKVAGASFEQATRPAAADPAAVAGLVAADRDSLLRWLDELSAELAALRRAVADGDTQALADRFAGAVAERDRWLADRAAGKLLEAAPAGSQMPSKTEMFDAFLGSYLRRNLARQPGKGGKDR